MARTIFSGAWRIGRTMALMIGLAVILALVVGLASAAFGANGDPWRLGQNNVATAITTLGGAVGVDGPMVRLVNNNAGTNDTALDLRVQAGEAPMSVNSSDKVTNLNADSIDGKDSTQFLNNEIYRREAPASPGTDRGDGTFLLSQACDGGDVLLSGGPANLNASSDMVESFPTPNNLTSWTVRVNKNGFGDNWSVVVHCVNQTPGD